MEFDVYFTTVALIPILPYCIPMAKKKSRKGFADNLVGFFIGIMVVVIIAVSVVIPTIQDQVTAYAALANASATVVTLLNLIPLFIVLAILVLVVGLMRF